MLFRAGGRCRSLLSCRHVPDAQLGDDRLLARPTDRIADPRGVGYQPGTALNVSCTVTACFHWAETISDAVDPNDAGANGVPDYIDVAEQTVSHVQQRYLDAGYKAVEGDGMLGGNALPDLRSPRRTSTTTPSSSPTTTSRTPG